MLAARARPPARRSAPGWSARARRAAPALAAAAPGVPVTMRCRSSNRRDRRAVDRDDRGRRHAARPGRRRRLGDHLADHRARATGRPDGREQAGEQHGGEQEIGDRAGRHDDGARAAPAFRGRCGPAARWRAPPRTRLPAAPARAASRSRQAGSRRASRPCRRGRSSSQRPAEADREGLDMHAAPARGEVVAELVDEDEHAQHDHEGDDGADDLGNAWITRISLVSEAGCVVSRRARGGDCFGGARERPHPVPMTSSSVSAGGVPSRVEHRLTTPRCRGSRAGAAGRPPPRPRSRRSG